MILHDYDALLVDLDGTIVLADTVIPYAVDALTAAARAGVPALIVTNNASRTPVEVAQRLTDRDIPMQPDRVVTSPQAAATLLADAHEAEAPILVVGSDALRAEVREVGLTPVRSADDSPVAVVQGFSPDIGWTDLAEACLALGAGADWVATNMDTTLPTDRGLLPGNGSLVATLTTATGRQPRVAGKPERPLVDAARRRVGATRPLVIGDRLGTDIAAAVAADCDSLLVLTGVSTVQDVVATPAERRPTYLARDLRALTDGTPVLRIADFTTDDQLLRAAAQLP